MSASTKNIFAGLGYFLFFMMLFVPTVYQPVKAILLVIVIASIGINILIHNGSTRLHSSVLLWTLLMASTGLAFILLGVINNAPGALRVATVYVLWPLVYTVLVAGVNDQNIINGLFKLLVFATIAISLYIFMFLLYEIRWLPEYLYINLNQGQAMGIYKGYIEYSLYSLSSLLFLVPFLIGVVFTWPKKQSMPVSIFCVRLALLLGLICVLLSGRKALWLVVAIAPVTTFIFWMFERKDDKRNTWKQLKNVFLSSVIVTLCLYLSLQWIVDININAIIVNFLTGFDFNSDVSANARQVQFFSLFQGWKIHPLIGAGLGASASVLRSSAQPWSYELSYVALLFHVGIIGFSIYLSGIIWIFWMGIKIIRSNDSLRYFMLPVLVGTVSFLIANVSNPYFCKYDYIWVIFLPVALINRWLLSKSHGAYKY